MVLMLLVSIVILSSTTFGVGSLQAGQRSFRFSEIFVIPEVEDDVEAVARNSEGVLPRELLLVVPEVEDGVEAVNCNGEWVLLRELLSAECIICGISIPPLLRILQILPIITSPMINIKSQVLARFFIILLSFPGLTLVDRGEYVGV